MTMQFFSWSKNYRHHRVILVMIIKTKNTELREEENERCAALDFFFAHTHTNHIYNTHTHNTRDEDTHKKNYKKIKIKNKIKFITLSTLYL